jgi:thioredoxin 1
MGIDAPIHSSEANFSRVITAGLPVLVVLWRRDCPTCEQLNPTLETLAKRYAGKALVVKVSADEERSLAQKLGASEFPGLFLYKDGQEVERGAGAAPERELATWLDYLGGSGARPPAPRGPATGTARTAGPSSAGGPATGSAVYGQPAPRRAAAGVKAEPVTVTDANFEQVVLRSNLPVLVDFWAVWCGPCKMIAPHVAALAQEFAGKAVIGKLNVDENPRVAGQYGIMSIPTLLIFKGGKVVDQIVGAQPAQALRQRLSRVAG